MSDDDTDENGTPRLDRRRSDASRPPAHGLNRLTDWQQEILDLVKSVASLIGRVTALENQLPAIQRHLDTQDRENADRFTHLEEMIGERLKTMGSKIEQYDGLVETYLGADGWTAKQQKRLDVMEKSVQNFDVFMTTWNASEEHRRQRLVSVDQKMGVLQKSVTTVGVPIVAAIIGWLTNASSAPIVVKSGAYGLVAVVLVGYLLYVAFTIGRYIMVRLSSGPRS